MPQKIYERIKIIIFRAFNQHDLKQRAKISSDVIRVGYDQYLSTGLPMPKYFDVIDDVSSPEFVHRLKSIDDERFRDNTISSICCRDIAMRYNQLRLILEYRNDYDFFYYSVAFNFYTFNMMLDPRIYSNHEVKYEHETKFYEELSKRPEGFAMLENILLDMGL